MGDPREQPEPLESGEHNVGAHVVAWFTSMDEVRHAVLALERNGVDSTYIEMARRSPREGSMLSDKRSMARLAKLALLGALGGSALVAGVAVLVALILGLDGSTIAAVAIAGAIFGAFAGGFCLPVVQTPVNAASFDTFGGEPQGSDWIAVGGPNEVQQKAVSVLGDLKPIQLSEAA